MPLCVCLFLRSYDRPRLSADVDQISHADSLYPPDGHEGVSAEGTRDARQPICYSLTGFELNAHTGWQKPNPRRENRLVDDMRVDDALEVVLGLLVDGRRSPGRPAVHRLDARRCCSCCCSAADGYNGGRSRRLDILCCCPSSRSTSSESSSKRRLLFLRQPLPPTATGLCPSVSWPVALLLTCCLAEDSRLSRQLPLMVSFVNLLRILVEASSAFPPSTPALGLLPCTRLSSR